jgi:O-methyltransferase involved in polyketide biosynthesis
MMLPKSLQWIEADYPAIISHKESVLRDSTPSCKLTRVAIDLADGEKRREFLASAAPDAKRVLILTEGVIVYLSPEQVSELARDLLAQPRFAYWIAEYFNPKVYPHLQRAVRTIKMRNAPFLFYPDDWYGFFARLGWAERETRYSGEVAVEHGRRPPMPWFARLLYPFFPRKAKEEAMRMTGYVVFRRA